jgi:hypothetical protein
MKRSAHPVFRQSGKSDGLTAAQVPNELVAIPRGKHGRFRWKDGSTRRGNRRRQLHRHSSTPQRSYFEQAYRQFRLGLSRLWQVCRRDLRGLLDSARRLASSTATMSQLLIEWGKGNEAARDQLMPLVYRELHRMASRYMGSKTKESICPATAHCSVHAGTCHDSGRFRLALDMGRTCCNQRSCRNVFRMRSRRNKPMLAKNPGEEQMSSLLSADHADKPEKSTAGSFIAVPSADSKIHIPAGHAIPPYLINRTWASAIRAHVLANEGIPTRIDSAHKNTYDKYLVIDGHSVETGSFKCHVLRAMRQCRKCSVWRIMDGPMRIVEGNHAICSDIVTSSSVSSRAATL